MTDPVWDSASPNKPSTDRLPPHSPEAEVGILGCILLSPNECIPESIEKLRSEGQEFYDLRNMVIYETFVEMWDKGVVIDTISTMEALKNKDMLDQCGGVQYLSALPEGVPSAANLSYYLDIVVEKFVLRKMIQTCTEVVGRVYDYEGEVDELMDSVESDLLSIRDRRQDKSVPTIKELIQGNMTTIETFIQGQGVLTGVPTGFPDLDKMTAGFQQGDMIVIAARPSMGKTSLAMNIVENVAIDYKIPVGVFSLEMSAPSLTLRMLCSRARVNVRNIRDGFLAERDFPKLTGAAGKLANAPIYIDDSPSLTVIQLRAKARRMVQRWGVKMFAVDYIQLLRGTRKRVESRQQEVSEISQGIKALAKELNVPIIVLSQLNREVEREKGRKPRLSDLRESGAIEQDADFVGFLYRPTLEDDEDPWDMYEAIPTNLLIGKQRNGPTGEVDLTFLKSFTRFESAARVSDEDVPEQKELLS